MMGTAIEMAQKYMKMAAAARRGYEEFGDLAALGEANGCMDLATQYATIAQAEAAERQAAAMERMAAAVEYMASGGRTANAAVVQEVFESRDLEVWPDDNDQRTEDDASYSAGIAPGLHR